MKARAQVLKCENVKGTSTKTGNAYDLDFVHFLDKDSYDKIKLLVPKDQVQVLKAAEGKEGVLEVCVNAKTEKLEFSGFKAVA